MGPHSGIRIGAASRDTQRCSVDLVLVSCVSGRTAGVSAGISLFSQFPKKGPQAAIQGVSMPRNGPQREVERDKFEWSRETKTRRPPRDPRRASSSARATSSNYLIKR